VSILRWPAEVREHRSWSDEPTELTDWYVCGRRVTLNWSPAKNWGLGARRFGNAGFSLEAGPLFLFLDFKVAE